MLNYIESLHENQMLTLVDLIISDWSIRDCIGRTGPAESGWRRCDGLVADIGEAQVQDPPVGGYVGAFPGIVIIAGG